MSLTRWIAVNPHDIQPQSSSSSPAINHNISSPALQNPPMPVISSQNTPMYRCQYAGCNEPPFQTRHLLKYIFVQNQFIQRLTTFSLHSELHEEPTVYFCSVAGCSRGKGGRGFETYFEKIRHALDHWKYSVMCTTLHSDDDHPHLLAKRLMTKWFTKQICAIKSLSMILESALKFQTWHIELEHEQMQDTPCSGYNLDKRM